MIKKRENENIVWHHNKISKDDRMKVSRQKGVTLWFTGLSGSGKSTIAVELEHFLCLNGYYAYILDGDNIRHNLNKDLSFSREDKRENIRRVAEVANLFADANFITLAAFISPYTSDREIVRAIHKENSFIEIYIKCPLSLCEERDTKNLYKKARAGQIKDFIGIDTPYEEPLNPEITLDTSILSVGDCVEKITYYLRQRGYIK